MPTIQILAAGDTVSPVALSVLTDLATRTITRALPHSLQGTTVQIEYSIVSDAEIQKLNQQYRSVDKVTDILSFGDADTPEFYTTTNGGEVFLGQLALNHDYLVHGAEEDGVSLEHEWVFVFVHGVLHLLGFDHSPEMFFIQDTVTEEWVREARVVTPKTQD